MDLSSYSGWASPEDTSGIYSGDPYVSQTVGVQSDPSASPLLPGDVYDAQQMAPWNPPAAQQQGAPWWAGIAAYGITRAIDNVFPGSPTGMQGNVYPGSAAGYNGRTYTLRPLAAGGTVAQAKVSIGGNPLLLGALLVGAVLLLK